MPEHLYKGCSIHCFSYQADGQWLPFAVVFLKTSTGTEAHVVTSHTGYLTEQDANAEAERLAKEWIDTEAD